MATFDKVRAGDVLYDVHSEKMGNTTMGRVGWWRVVVVSIDHENGEAMCHWNGNPAVRYGRMQIAKLRRSIPKALAESQGLGTITP